MTPSSGIERFNTDDFNQQFGDVIETKRDRGAILHESGHKRIFMVGGEIATVVKLFNLEEMGERLRKEMKSRINYQYKLLVLATSLEASHLPKLFRAATDGTTYLLETRHRGFNVNFRYLESRQQMPYGDIQVCLRDCFDLNEFG